MDSAEADAGRQGRQRLVIRRARAEEYELIGSLTVLAYLADGFIEEGSDYQLRLKDARHRAEAAELLVAVDRPSAVVVGSVTFAPPGSPYAQLAHGTDEAEFRMLAVVPYARQRGVGEALVRACVDRAVALGLHRLVLASAAEMAAAHRLYRRLGFHRVPGLDWSPVPEVRLLAFAKDLRAK